MRTIASTIARSAVIASIRQSGSRNPSHLPTNCPHSEWGNAGNWHYPLEKCHGYEDLEDRVVIDWGKAALAWHQWFTDRPVLEIRAQGRALPPFRDYLRVNFSFGDLVRLAATPEAHRDWVASLSAIGAIYLIVNGREWPTVRRIRDWYAFGACVAGPSST